jgi:hypothetical protein
MPVPALKILHMLYLTTMVGDLVRDPIKCLELLRS